MTIQIDNVDTSISAVGTDANIAIDLQPKGTGALNVAAGSSGVNISNGTTVTGITGTAAGISYTSIPSVIISAPQAANGVQATVDAQMQFGGNSPTIVSGGTGYTVNDVLTVVGGTGTAATITVTTVSGGVITGANYATGGTYSVLPTLPVSVTGGTGSSATFTGTFAVRTTAYTITNAGSGYVEQPTVTFSGGGGGSGAVAYARIGGDIILKSLSTNLLLNTPGGTILRLVDNTLGANTGYVQISNAQGNGGATITTTGSNLNTAVFLGTGGTGAVNFFTNGSSNRQLLVAHTASAVNYVQVTGAVAGSAPVMSAQGSDTNIPLTITSKGTSGVRLQTGGGIQAIINNTASAVNQIGISGAAAGTAPYILAQGSDTNIPLVLQPKGTGALQAQQTDSTTTGGNARGANAVDWQTSRGGAAQVASATGSAIVGGASNSATGTYSTVAGGFGDSATGAQSFVGGGENNTASGTSSSVVGGHLNTAAGRLNFIGGGETNSGTANAAVTTQATTTVTSGSTAVTLSASNASIRVGQLITGTGIQVSSSSLNYTYVAAISGTSLTLSQNATATGTPTLSFFTPHGVVVGGGNNQATGSYSFIGGGGDAGTAANRNVASGDWATVGGGRNNTASGGGAFVGGGGVYPAINNTYPNTASGVASVVVGGLRNTASGEASFVGGGIDNLANARYSTIVGGTAGTTRSITGNTIFPAHETPVAGGVGVSQSALLILGTQTTDATATALRSNTAAAGTTNQVILPNNSAYLFRATVISGVTGGGNTSAWIMEGAIKRGANAASTAIVGSVTTNLLARDAGASTWAIAATADTTNGGLAITFTGQAGTTIRTVAKVETTEMTF
jgi:hypothetical protein